MAETPLYYDAAAMFAVLKRQGRSLLWLASETGYEYGYVRKIKAGVKPATGEFANKASRALGLPIEVLFSPIVLRSRSKQEPRGTTEAAD